MASSAAVVSPPPPKPDVDFDDDEYEIEYEEIEEEIEVEEEVEIEIEVEVEEEIEDGVDASRQENPKSDQQRSHKQVTSATDRIEELRKMDSAISYFPSLQCMLFDARYWLTGTAISARSGE